MVNRVVTRGILGFKRLFDGIEALAERDSRQTTKRNVEFLELLDRHGRVALVRLIFFQEAGRNPRFGSNLAAFGDCKVPPNAHLSSNHAPGAERSGARDASLGCNDRGLPNDHVVRHLNEVVQLASAANDRASQRRPVHDRHGSDVAIVLNDDVASLRDLA